MKNDLISRKAAIEALAGYLFYDGTIEAKRQVFELNDWKWAIKGALSDLPAVKSAPQWVPVMDGDGKMPPVNEEGFSKFILLSFSNVPGILCIGRYDVDADGSGAFYGGDDDEPLTTFGIFVNAWMDLPDSYREYADDRN